MPTIETWWEIAVVADPEMEDLIFWRLQDFGCQGTASQVHGDGTSIRAYLPREKIASLDLAALALLLVQDAIAIGHQPPLMHWDVIQNEDWSSSWKQHWQPQDIGDLFTISPAWIDPPADGKRLIVRLDPGSAFGTGTHATTQMCLESLEFRMWGAEKAGNVTFADIGCGSGILAIGAVLLGAAKVYAVDTDIMAVKASYHNFALNHIPTEKTWIQEGSLTHLLDRLTEPVHGFACNIQLEPILQLIPRFAELVRPDGWGIISGVLLEQVPQLAEALDAHQWVVATLWKRKDWSCLTIRRA